jgi:hypothetical protein
MLRDHLDVHNLHLRSYQLLPVSAERNEAFVQVAAANSQFL